MGNIFMTSDCHYGHKNIIRFCNRPFKDVVEMRESLIKNWNDRVTYQDSVYVLGDFSFEKNDEDTSNILNRLNGQKFLVLGNHDNHLKSKSLSKFSWVKNYYELRDGDNKLVLFHFPISVWNKGHHGSYHLHGHVHGSHNDCKIRRYDVGVDVVNHNYAPVSLDEIYDRLKNATGVKHHYYKEDV